LDNAPTWALRLVVGVTVFLDGVGLAGFIHYSAYDPHGPAQVSVTNQTAGQIAVQWDSAGPEIVPGGVHVELQGSVSHHVVRIADIGTDDLSFQLSFDALESGSDLSIEVGQIPVAEPARLP